MEWNVHSSPEYLNQPYYLIKVMNWYFGDAQLSFQPYNFFDVFSVKSHLIASSLPQSYLVRIGIDYGLDQTLINPPLDESIQVSSRVPSFEIRIIPLFMAPPTVVLVIIVSCAELFIICICFRISLLSLHAHSAIIMAALVVYDIYVRLFKLHGVN